MNARFHRRLLAIFAIAVLAGPLNIVLTPQTPAPIPLTMLSREGRRTIPLVLVNKQEFVAIDDLAGPFQLSVREDALGALTVTYKDKTIVLTNQALASVAGRLVSLPSPASRAGARWLVPVEFINRALGLVYESRLELRKPAHLLLVGDVRVPRVTVRYDLLATGGRLTIDATPRAESTVTQDNDLLSIKFDADALDVDTPPLPPPAPQGLVQAVRILDATTLGVDLGPRVAGIRSTTLPADTTLRVMIDILAAGTEAAPSAPAVAGDPPGEVAGVRLPLGPPASPIQTITIDPGHGGDDIGTQGMAGVKEKDLTLAVARLAKAAIEARLGIRVLLTRDGDRDVPLEDRTAVANNNKADLFISLHANSSFRPETAGASIYYAAFDNSIASAGPGGVDRVPTFSGAMRDLELVAWDLAQTHHVDQSRMFATILEERLRDRVPLALQPVESAPLAVIESANMPAVLVDIGFLTNPAQEKLLAGNEFQNDLAQAMTDAVVRFRDALAARTAQ
ncbi:MAG TPA: N-acetylmuramoyl-L-alanine amidase [Vicinamibacterales bacterium]|nr:N-acetylmuramoyl-L-alanine amidase [Vicinamibacterales bacterium]